MDQFEVELKAGFLEEAAQSVADVEQCFLDLETDPQNVDNLNKIFRLAHNLKGSSRAVGFEDLGHFTHEFETFILRIKNGELPASPAVVNLLLRANDHVRMMIETYKADMEAKIPNSDLMTEMVNFSDAGAGSESEPEPEVVAEEPVIEAAPEELVAPQAPAHDADQSNRYPSIEELLAQAEAEVAAEAAPAPVVPAPVAAETPALPPLPQSPAVPAASSAPPSGQAPPAGASAKAAVTEESIRVALSKVENLIDYIGEMVILQNVLREQVSSVESVLLRKTINQLGKVGKEIQDLAMSLRMVPIKPTFQKMQRIVRDTAQSLKKDVGINLIGEETELDKTVLELINDPLVHLVRNSVDHGIEVASVRQSRGKPERGTVTLAAFHQAGRLILEIRDDGGGLDAEKLKRKAIEKGLIKSGAVLSEKEAYQLIFAPGFSTAEKVTDVSGRGVGMDVVRTNIQELGGEINIESTLGKGTTFRISLPLTLAIIDAMVMTYNQERFVLPLSHVHETLQPKPDMVQRSTNLGDVLLLRGENLPLYRLGDFFGMKSTNSVHSMIAMVVRTGPQPFALLVDDILGQQQVVIKQLSSELGGLKGISGTTILGDGKPSLILEPAELVKRKLSLSPLQQGVAS